MSDNSMNLKDRNITENSGKEVDRVSQKILDDALNKKQEILNDAGAKQKEILEVARNKREIILKDAEKESKIRYTKVRELEILKAKSRINQEVLLKKIGIIEDIIREAREKIESSNSKEFLSALKKIIGSLSLSDPEYQLGRNEKLIPESFIKEISVKTGFKKSVEAPDFESGIKIIDGRKEYVISVNTLIKEKIDIIKIKLSKFLFEKG